MSIRFCVPPDNTTQDTRNLMQRDRPKPPRAPHTENNQHNTRQPFDWRQPPSWLRQLWAVGIALAVLVVLLWRGPWLPLIISGIALGGALVVFVFAALVLRGK